MEQSIGSQESSQAWHFAFAPNLFSPCFSLAAAHLWSEFQRAKAVLPSKTAAPARSAASPTKRAALASSSPARRPLTSSADAGASPAQLLSPSRRAARPIVASALRHLQARRDAAAATALASAAAGSPSSPSLSGSLPGQRSGAGGSPGGGKENEGAAAAAVGGKGQDLSKAPCSAPSAAPPPQSTPLRARGVAGACGRVEGSGSERIPVGMERRTPRDAMALSGARELPEW